MGIDKNGQSEVVAISPSSSLGAAAVGGGGAGTLLVVLAQNIPDSWPYKSLLVISAPSISILLTWLWIQIDKLLKTMMIDWKISRMQKSLQARISNPNTPTETRAVYVKHLKILEEKKFQKDLKVFD